MVNIRRGLFTRWKDAKATLLRVHFVVLLLSQMVNFLHPTTACRLPSVLVTRIGMVYSPLLYALRTLTMLVLGDTEVVTSLTMSLSHETPLRFSVSGFPACDTAFSFKLIGGL